MWEHGWPYLAAAALAAVSSTAELMRKFRDQPFLVLRTLPGALYVLFNAVVGAAALGVLRYLGDPATNFAVLEQVVLAGFGARLVLRMRTVPMRSRGGEEEEAGIGPAVENLLVTLNRAVDRKQATQRLQSVAKRMEGIPFDEAVDFFLAQLGGAMQSLTDEEKQSIAGARADIEALHPAARSDLLGYMILEIAGPRFLDQLVAKFKALPPEQRRPPPPPD